jgi:hypothetical protein
MRKRQGLLPLGRTNYPPHGPAVRLKHEGAGLPGEWECQSSSLKVSLIRRRSGPFANGPRPQNPAQQGIPGPR